jgi:hypothetical protein
MTANKETLLREESKDRKSGRALYWVFVAIWMIAMAVTVNVWNEIPTYMLLVASIFFLMLVPSMVELVQDYDKFITRFGSQRDAPNIHSNSGDNHD